ncbi:hypothetical protein RJT34_16179 [Clitoria ternatea]|uniref:Uncharacterized protein n=1 Tax=Clitoria ternatea TaxID=43366 RepID=A0AAN9PCN5_CLITE
MQDMKLAKRGYNCIPNFGSKSKTMPSCGLSWWAKGWNKIKEWSKLMAGQCKTFIRYFNKNHAIGYTKQRSFHYDSFSYARNFDDGMNECYDDYAYEFSSRYAFVPASAKSSMDLGKGGPSFI